MSVSPITTTRIHKDHPKAQIIGEVELKKVTRALDDESWVEAMQEELLQFKLLNIWTLVDLPHGKKAIGTKWVFRNKRDQQGIVVRNKARLVAQGYRQEEGVDYDEQTVRMWEGNLVHVQAERDQWRGSSMSLVKMLRIRSSDKELNVFGLLLLVSGGEFEFICGSDWSV
ncbi:putative ribonuclease H-like domain-containing protein [Tanacetum coccineum]